MLPELASAISQLGVATRHEKKNPTPEAREALKRARRDFRAVQAEDYIRRLVDSAPPLTDKQRRDLAVLLAPREVA